MLSSDKIGDLRKKVADFTYILFINNPVSLRGTLQRQRNNHTDPLCNRNGIPNKIISKNQRQEIDAEKVKEPLIKSALP